MTPAAFTAVEGTDVATGAGTWSIESSDRAIGGAHKSVYQ